MDQKTAQRHFATVEKALHYLQQHQAQQPSLTEIAAHCAMSEHHFQRVFTAWAGTSPKRFLQHLTKEQCRERLLQGDSLLNSSAASGLSGGGRLHDLWVTLEAVTPGQLKSGGSDVTFYYGLHHTPFGECFVAVSARGLHQLEFISAEQLTSYTQQLQDSWPNATLTRDQAQTAVFIERIFAPRQYPSDSPQAALKLWLKATPFQLKVWESLLKIPAGRLCSYQALAELIGQPAAARAVGNAVAKNPVALLIPCHRVIRGMGVIGQYRWGTTRKQALLGWEACQITEDISAKTAT